MIKFKYFFNNSIYEIDNEEFEKLLKIHDEHKNYTCEQKQLFIMFNDNKYIAVDNTTGEFYVEEFRSLSAALAYLMNIQDPEPLHEAEKNDFWY